MAAFTFTPTATAIYQFQPTLDGTVYAVFIRWNVWAQRWYFNLYRLDNTLVLAQPLVPSPDDYDINLIEGYFTTSTMVFRDSSQQFIVTP